MDIGNGRLEIAILNFISKQIKANQYPPSVREICKAVGLNSTATVHGYLEKLEVHEVRRIEKVGRLSRDIIKEESEKCGHKLMILDTIEKERRYECSLEDFLSVAREIPLKDQETVNTEEKNVQEDNSEDSKSKLGDSDCAPWIED